MPTSDTSTVVAVAAIAWCFGIVCFRSRHRLRRLWRKAPVRRGLEQFILRRKPLPQFVPDVTSDDVRRVVNREFPRDEVAAVTAALNDPLSSKPSPRLQLAVLKLAGGSIERLQAYLKEAQRDYRDVLGAAENPAYQHEWQRNHDMSIKERNAAIENDRRQYEEWLRK
jgi:hypothetical protein